MRLPDDLFSVSDIARGPSLPPTALPPLGAGGARAVAACARGGTKTLAVTADGALYSWGTCDHFSLGHGEGVTRAGLPRRVEALAGIRVVAVDAGDTSAAALSAEGELFTWGWGGSYWGGNGGLGHGNAVTQPRPALVEGVPPLAAVAVGAQHMLGLGRDGSVWAWGHTEFGRCGNGARAQAAPARVEVLAGERATGVAAGRDFSLAVTSDGAVWAWGKNDASQLGLGAGLIADLNTMEEYPCKVELEGEEGGAWNGRVARVAAGANHALAVTLDGAVYEWGGRSALAPARVPRAVDAAGNAKPLRAVDVAAGEGVSAAIDAGGALFTWGRASHAAALGRSGAGVMSSRGPTAVPALAGQRVRAVSMGAQHAAAVVV